MGEIAASLLAHRVVGIDTSVFIYHIEEAPRYCACTKVLFDQMVDGSFEGVTSVLTLMELAVKPLQMGKPDVADEYEVILSNYPNLTIAKIDRATARRAAELRATYKLRPADALQVAACIEHGATAFLSNDRDLRRVSELSVLLLDDFV